MTVVVREPVNFGIWIGRVLGWDGCLPFVATSLFIAVAWMFPRNQLVAEVTVVALPMAAFLVRLAVGVRQIKGNDCRPVLRVMQFVALEFAILLFLFIDFFIVLSAFVPKNRPFPEDLVPIAVGFLTSYSLLVVFAMYPGRKSAAQSSSAGLPRQLLSD